MFPSRYFVLLCFPVFCLWVHVYCTALLQSGVNPIVVNKYIILYSHYPTAEHDYM